MLRKKIFVVLFLVYMVDAQYRRLPQRPNRPIPLRPAIPTNVKELEPILDPSPIEKPSDIEEGEQEASAIPVQFPDKLINRPLNNRRPLLRPQRPVRPVPRPDRPLAPIAIPVNIADDRTESNPNLVIVYPENSRLITPPELLNPLLSQNLLLSDGHVPFDDFLNFNPTPELPIPQPSFPIYEPEVKLEVKPEPPTYEFELEPKLNPEIKANIPTNEPEIETKPSLEIEPTYEPEEKPEPSPESEPIQWTYEPITKPQPGSEMEPELPIYEPEEEPQPNPETGSEMSEYKPETEPSPETEFDSSSYKPESELIPESNKVEPEFDPKPWPEMEITPEPEEPAPDQEKPVYTPDTPLEVTSDENLDVPEEPEKESDANLDAQPQPEQPELKPPPHSQHPLPRPTQRPSRPPAPNYGRPTPEPPRPSRPTIAPSKPYIPTKYPTGTIQPKPINGFVCDEPNGYYAVAKECDTYIECKKSVARKHVCPDGLLFNQQAYWPQYPCVYPSQVRCGNKTVIQKPKPNGECPRRFGTFRSNTGDCGKYIVCQDGRPNLMTCPYGLAFNPRSSGCDWPENVPSCNPNVFQDFTCPTPPKDQYGRVSEQIYTFRFRNSCKEYIACLKGEPRLLRCDSGLSFDQETGRCVNSDTVVNCSV